MPGPYVCPGIRPGARRPRHNGGCCASFAALSPEQRIGRGLPRVAHPIPADRPRPPEPETITVTGLARLVADLQRRAEQAYYHGQPAPTIVWLEIGPDESFDEAMALIELGSPYGLVAGYRQLTEQRAAV